MVRSLPHGGKSKSIPTVCPLRKSRGWPHSKAESTYSWAVPLLQRPLIGLHGALNPVLGASESLQAPSKGLRCVTEACHAKRGKVPMGRTCSPKVELYQGQGPHSRCQASSQAAVSGPNSMPPIPISQSPGQLKKKNPQEQRKQTNLIRHPTLVITPCWWALLLDQVALPLQLRTCLG